MDIFKFINKYLFLILLFFIVGIAGIYKISEAAPGSSNLFNLNPATGQQYLQGCTGNADNCLKFLAPIPGLPSSIGQTPNIGGFVNVLFSIGIGIAGLLAVIMLIVAGLEYMSTDAISGKSEAKGRIMGAIMGLIIALGAFVILNTINPDLLNIGF